MSLRATWQRWLTVNPHAPGLNDKGRELAGAARIGFAAFERTVHRQLDKKTEDAPRG
jgi:hypothetical protein